MLKYWNFCMNAALTFSSSQKICLNIFALKPTLSHNKK